ncbi:MAG: protein kinase [Planctomycetota bacterium]
MTDPKNPDWPRGEKLDGLDPERLLRAAADRSDEEDFFFDDEPGPEVERIRATVAEALPDYADFEMLGRGGMGLVFRARHARLDRAVAVKVLLRRRVGSEELAARFEREARALAQLDHPNIVRVYDYGEAGNLPYLIMEYVDGASLRQILESEAFRPEEALALVPELCDALSYAHEKGVVHRDIKPENILLDRTGRLKIADFGIAKIADGDAPKRRLTGSRMVMGTPHYMAPEQAERPQEVDHRADIYSLGVVLYEMLTGELPVGVFPPPSKKVQVDVRIDEVVLKSLEKEPARRYQSAREVRDRITGLDREPVEAGFVAAAPRPPSAEELERARGGERREAVAAAPAREKRSILRFWWVFLLLMLCPGAPVALFWLFLGVAPQDGPMPGSISRDSLEGQTLSPQDRLSAAVRRDDPPLEVKRLRELIGENAKIDGRDSRGETPLVVAVRAKRLRALRDLLGAGAAPDLADASGTPPIVWAAILGELEMVRELVAAGADVDVLDARGARPIDMAVARGDVALAGFLVGAGASIAKVGSNVAPFDCVIDPARPTHSIAIATRIADALDEDALEDPDEAGRTPLLRAIGFGAEAPALRLLERGASPLAVDAGHRSALHLAIEVGSTKLVEALLSRGAPTDCRDLAGRTPLHLAAERGVAGLPALRALIAGGADAKSEDRVESSVLAAAVRGGSLEAVEALLEVLGPDAPELVDQKGMTPIRWAVARGHPEIEALFVRRGARVPLDAIVRDCRRFLRREAWGEALPRLAEVHSRLAEEPGRDAFVFAEGPWVYEIYFPKLWVEMQMRIAALGTEAVEDLSGLAPLPAAVPVMDASMVVKRRESEDGAVVIVHYAAGAPTFAPDGRDEELLRTTFLETTITGAGTQRQKVTGWAF